MVAKHVQPSDVTERYTVSGMTCSACAEHVEAALRAVPGVQSAMVDLGSATAAVRRNPDVSTSAWLEQAVATAGYGLSPLRGASEMHPRTRPLLFGLSGVGGLLVVYLSIITLAQGWGHATQQLAEERLFVGAITVGFGVQIGLFIYLWQLHTQAVVGGVAVSTGTSRTSMLACCAHHFAGILPVIGLSGAAVFLNGTKTPLLWLVITMNVAGTAYMLWLIRRQRRLACHSFMGDTASRGAVP